MSAISIVSKKNNCLCSTQKIACLRTKYYQYRQRLEYKCLSYKVNFKVVNESYTSQACSICGNLKKDVGSCATYTCLKCNRDVNGARNIYIRSLL